MAKKKLTPEEEAAKAAQAAKAAAKPKPKKTSAQDMSGGAVKPAPKVDAAAKGASAMGDFLSGTRADGSYMSGSERKSAFQATRDTRFTMPGQTPVERAIVPVQQVDRTLATTAQPAANAAEANAAKMSQAAEAAKGPGKFRRFGAPSIVPLAALGADAVIPRANDATDVGYDLNTTRDAAMGAINDGSIAAIAKNALKLRNPYLVGGAALLGGGRALYNRLTDYNAANPEAANRDYELPKADVNFFSQAPAALSDAGRVASQVLRGIGDGVSYVNTYNPTWKAAQMVGEGAKAVGNYFTPPSMKGEAPAAPVAPQTEAMDPGSMEGPLNADTQRLPDGQFQRSLYGPDGTFRGTATGSMGQMDRVARTKAQDAQDQARQQVMENIRRREEEREIADRERTSPEATQQWFAQKRAEASLRDALNRGGSRDPVVNAEKVQDIVDAANSASSATGRPVEELLPETGNRNVRIAREVLARQASSERRLTPEETGLLSAAMTPGSAVNYYGDNETYAQEMRKQAVGNMTAASNALGNAEQEQRLQQNLTLDEEKFAISQAEAEAQAAAAPEAAAKEKQDYEEWRREKAIKSLQDAVKDRASAMNTAGADPKANDSLDQLDQIIRLNARAAIEAGIPESEINSMLTAGQPRVATEGMTPEQIKAAYDAKQISQEDAVRLLRGA